MKLRAFMWIRNSSSSTGCSSKILFENSPNQFAESLARVASNSATCADVKIIYYHSSHCDDDDALMTRCCLSMDNGDNKCQFTRHSFRYRSSMHALENGEYMASGNSRCVFSTRSGPSDWHTTAMKLSTVFVVQLKVIVKKPAFDGKVGIRLSFLNATLSKVLHYNYSVTF